MMPSQRRTHGKIWRLLGCAVVCLGWCTGVATAACITDDTDTEVCVAEPHRVISLYGAFTELLWEIGAGDRLVARTKNDTTVPAVAAFDPRGVEDVFTTTQRLGQLTGTAAGAARLLKNVQGRLAAVRAVTAAVAEDQRPRVVCEVRADPLTVAGQGGLVNDLITAAGGRNAVTSPKKLLRLDVEALLRLTPDAYLVQEGPMNRNPLPPAERPLAAGGHPPTTTSPRTAYRPSWLGPEASACASRCRRGPFLASTVPPR